MNISDVMIHINESLGEEARSSLENSLRKVEGVVTPRFNAGKEHLLVIAYDTEKTNTAVLLEKTRAAGYTAQLVGM
jgi:3-hydroxy-3-methylglutaryl CoA synthase